MGSTITRMGIVTKVTFQMDSGMERASLKSVKPEMYFKESSETIKSEVKENISGATETYT